MTFTTDDTTVLNAVDPGDGDALWFLATRMTLKASAATTGGLYGLLEVEVPAGFSPPRHIHHREDEAFYVLDGQVTFQCGDQRISATAGSYVFLPRHVPHSFVVEGEGPARMLNITTPGGGEGFFVEAGRPAEGPGLPPVGPPDVEALRAASDHFGSEIVGPPLAPAS
jgi:quercetin dioxygenase-like cupin family protein